MEEAPFAYLTSPSLSSFGPAYRSFLPKEHWELIKEKNGKLVISTKKPNMQYYGEGEDLAEMIRQYMGFPGSHDYFKTGLSTPYNTTPVIYESLKKNLYIYKHDVLISLLISAKATKVIPKDNRLSSILSIYLRTKELSLNGVCELVPYVKDEIAKVERNVEEEIRKMSISGKQHTLKEKTLEEVFELLKKILPVNIYDPEYTVLRKLLEKFHKEDPVKKNVANYENIINWAAIIINEVDQFTEGKPEWFSAEPEHTQQGNPEGQSFVRVFQTGTEMFVLLWEVEQTLEVLKLDSKFIEDIVLEDDTPNATIEFRPLFDHLGGDMNKIEFVVTPLIKPKPKALFIPMQNNSYGIYVVDAVIDLLRHFITVKKVFQNLDERQKYILLECFVAVANGLTGLKKANRFITEKFLLEFYEGVNSIIQKNNLKSTKETKEFRKVGTFGFTLKEFQKELKYLGIVATFPDVLGHVERVYDYINGLKAKQVLRTCDMIAAIELCQMICVFNNCEIDLFFHAHHACGRVGIVCRECVTSQELGSGWSSLHGFMR
ncbi:hypothetical protein GCK72_024787 [Caenorhabditis remanei]|uniref:DUF7809 domain-containing protein n=1 Tax=Caenorhabditis remanei TaxID=31234 RepID=A0A6A5G069_CAERE|nr:hypothetical protein GCK72_024787 [Caenorhabditis remanei]KAF1748320.1 hypothetical protein GCK72_024787 [Caenorhabditis remanei]